MPGDAEAFVALRREALDEEPLAFGASPEDDRGLSLPFVREALGPEHSSAVFGAFSPNLVGIVGLRREGKKKSAHKAYLWGVYVSTPHRGSGLGMALLEAAIGYARQLDGVTQMHLSVSEDAEPAVQLYERLGFRRWGTEPNALRWEGQAVAEHHMVLRL
jgi:ribosomal protein S18 acetylase RimI-like enzyme